MSQTDVPRACPRCPYMMLAVHGDGQHVGWLCMKCGAALPVTTPDDLDDDDLVEIHCAAEELDPDLFDPWSGDDA